MVLVASARQAVEQSVLTVKARAVERPHHVEARSVIGDVERGLHGEHGSIMQRPGTEHRRWESCALLGQPVPRHRDRCHVAGDRLGSNDQPVQRLWGDAVIDRGVTAAERHRFGPRVQPGVPDIERIEAGRGVERIGGEKLSEIHIRHRRRAELLLENRQTGRLVACRTQRGRLDAVQLWLHHQLAPHGAAHARGARAALPVRRQRHLRREKRPQRRLQLIPEGIRCAIVAPGEDFRLNNRLHRADLAEAGQSLQPRGRFIRVRRENERA